MVEKVSFDMHRIQNMTTQTQQAPNIQNCGWGINIDASLNQYIIFADNCLVGQRYRYDPTSDYLQSQNGLDKSISIDSSSLTDIVFVPPLSQVYINGQPDQTGIVKLYISGNPNNAKYIKITSFGSISVDTMK